MSLVREPRTVKSVFPSGDHEKLVISSEVKFVSCLGSPWFGWRHKFPMPPRVTGTSIASPSGDHVGIACGDVPGSKGFEKTAGPPSSGTAVERAGRDRS